MARKCPEWLISVVQRHDVYRNHILNKNDWTDEQKAFYLSGMNTMLEEVLHRHKCYHGFKHVDQNDNGLPRSMFVDENGDPKELSKIHEHSRSYYVS